MSVKNLYSIQDVKAQECLNVVMLKNNVEAERFFQAVCENAQSPVSRYPKDYKLLSLGSIDSETGVIQASPVPRDVTPYTWVDTFLVARKAVANGSPA